MINVDTIIAGLSLIIAIVSIAIAIKAYRIQVPKLVIKELFKSSYGATKTRIDNEEHILSTYVAYVNIRINNRSSSSVTISDIRLNYKGETFELVPLIEYWNDVYFRFYNEREIGQSCFSIDYMDRGVKIPFELKGYETKDIMCLFLNFPRCDKNEIFADILVEHTAKTDKKRIKLHLHDNEFEKYCCLYGVDQFDRSY